MKAQILPGVSIGRGCCVAAGAAVTKDVEDFSEVGGVLARLIQKFKKNVAESRTSSESRE